jgi:predicted permease
MNLLTHDSRQAWRQVIARPFLSLAIVITLALGIGASSAVFSLVYGILLRPYPYRDPDRLVRLQTVMGETAGNVRGVSIPDLEDLRAAASTVEALGAYRAFPNTLTVDGRAQAANLTYLDARTFPLLGVRPILGRGFSPEEDQFNGDVKKALLSHALWSGMFSSDPHILGKVIEARGDRYTVIGIMPPGFRFPEKSDLWIPLMARYAGYREPYWRDRGFRAHEVVVRLRPGTSIRQAQAEIQAAANSLAQRFPVTNRGTQIRLTPLRDSEVGNVKPHLWLLLAAVAMLLLIGCVNAANLLLAAAAAREKEMAVRSALGAGQWRIVRQLLVESLLLSTAGGLLGFGFAWAAVRAFPRVVPVDLPFWMRIEIDGSVIAFGIALSLVTGVLFGLAPALQLGRVDLNSVLKEGSRGSSGAGGRLRDVLVISEVALSLVLLCGAGLMAKSLANLWQVDMGVKADHLVIARMARFVPNAPQDELVRQYGGSFRHALERIARLPGVVSAGAGTDVPFSALEPRGDERNQQQFTIRGQNERDAVRNAPTQFASISPGYFETLGIRLIEGRTFTDADDLTQPVRLVINRSMAESLWPGQSAIGRQLRWGSTNQNPWMTVIGVVEDARFHPLETGRGFETYYFYRQVPIPQMQAIVRVQGDPGAMVARIRSAIAEADSQIAIVHVKTLDTLASETFWQRRLWGLLMSIFAGLALLLASLGLYGTVSYLAGLRTREIGIRMALGASRKSVLALVGGHGMTLTVIGVGIGLAGVFATGRLMRGLLFGVGSSDPVTLVVSAVVLLFVAMAACAFPALRAARIDPLRALRDE